MKPDSFLITKAHTKMLVQAIITLDVVDSYEEANTLLEQYRADPPSVELSTAPDAAMQWICQCCKLREKKKCNKECIYYPPRR